MFSKRMVLTISGIFVFAFCIILISVSLRHPDETNDGGSVLISLVSPVQGLVTDSIRFARRMWEHYFFLVTTAEENDELKNDLKMAEARNNRCTEIELSNERLRELLNFQKKETSKVIAAEVIGKDPSPWFKTVIIDKGRSDGVLKGSPVVVTQGVVGQAMTVSEHYSKVLLMIDRNSSVDALVQRTRARGIVEGKASDRCFLQYVLRKYDVRVDDVVVSSGLDGVYPKGLRIGHVSSVVRRNSGMFQKVEVTPYVDFEKLEEVLVVLKSPAKSMAK